MCVGGAAGETVKIFLIQCVKTHFGCGSDTDVRQVQVVTAAESVESVDMNIDVQYRSCIIMLKQLSPCGRFTTLPI